MPLLPSLISCLPSLIPRHHPSHHIRPRVPSWSHLHTICQPYMYVYMDGHQDLSVLAFALFCLSSCISSFPCAIFASDSRFSVSISTCPIYRLRDLHRSHAERQLLLLSHPALLIRCMLHARSSAATSLLRLCKLCVECGRGGAACCLDSCC